MKKRINKAVSVLLLSFTLLPLTSCGEDDPVNQEVEIVIPNPSTPEETFNLKRDIVGSWSVLEAKTKTVVFYADGHGYIEQSGERESFNWDTTTGPNSNITIIQYFEEDHGLPYYINVMQNKKNNSELIHFIDGMGSGTTSKLRYVTTFAGDNATFTLVRI